MYKLPVIKTFPDLEKYHQILSLDFPDFLNHYIELPILQRLSSVGLLCGTDWTPLYQNRFFYSRLDHSIGTALIAWHFTHSKKQAIAALLHDVSTPAFSHVSDFRKGDALTQEVTENQNAEMVMTDPEISVRVFEDGLYAREVSDYHVYPICDNDIPRLSADRLEYMFPSGMALTGEWTLEEVEREYNDISVLKDEAGRDELGFNHGELAEEYTEKFSAICLLLLKNENKLALNLLGDILNLSVKCGLCEERDFFDLGEGELMRIFLDFSRKEEEKDSDSALLASYIRTFLQMKSLKRSDHPLDGHYCISLPVKRRYIDPLVSDGKGKTCRLSSLSPRIKEIIEELLHFEDKPFGCVELF